MQELFKPIKGFDDYMVSNLGNVKSFKRHELGRLLKSSKGKSNYYHVGLRTNNITKTYRIHQLVAMAFLGHCPDGFNIVVDHKDNNTHNNNVKNLRLVSNRQNTSDYKNVSSKYVGVYWHKRMKKYYASIRINGKGIHLGTFEKELDASKAYQDKLKEITKDHLCQ